MKNHFQINFLLVVAVSLSSYWCAGQNVDFGKSYINVTKGNTGGTLETGDTIEIRATFVVRNILTSYDSCAFYDTIPLGTTYIPGTLRILTNEGLIYKQFSDASADLDEAWITGTGHITMHLGFNPASGSEATRFRRGTVASSHRPSFFSNCIMVMSYRVAVSASTHTIINTGGGIVTYKNGSAPEEQYRYPDNSVMVYPNFGMCSNSLGTNALGTESNGSFGSGIAQNRAASGNVPSSYNYTTFTAISPNDYYYGIANNTSNGNNFTTSDAWPKPDNATLPTHRIFEKWDIMGDHTGATNLTAGNPPGDNTTPAGYMLVINASYRTDSAFTQFITGLCPNTYYEISCWIRNVCGTCGFDSTGKSPGNPGYIPTAPGDSSGVHPNLTFDVNGIDYYTTGNIKYTGEWVKKGFTFLTGSDQTTLTLKLFNNAPGGGGNDWAIDDISVATCLPDMIYSPALNPPVCEGNPLTLSDTIQSFFDNYTYYKWQRSVDAGITWSDVTPDSGPATVSWTGSSWSYVTSYTIPPENLAVTDSGDIYRLIVATTISNLSDVTCQSTDLLNVVTLDIMDCSGVLSTDFISTSGKINNGFANIFWTTSKEEHALYYEVQRSNNGVDFRKVAIVNGRNGTTGRNSYFFSDIEKAGLKIYYRIVIRTITGNSKYSRTLQLNTEVINADFIKVVNPFTKDLVFEINMLKDSKIDIILTDAIGKQIREYSVNAYEGINTITIANTEILAPAIYILQVRNRDKVISRKVVKK